MEKFQWMKLLCSCILYLSFCYDGSITAADPEEDNKVHLNFSQPYIDVKVHETIYIKCSGSPQLTWDYKNPLGSSIIGYTKQVFDYKNESIIRLTFDYQDATGRYFCRNDYSEASIYIFVNGDELILSNFDISIYTKNKYIECFPTVSAANVTLWKDSELVPLEFDPTRGFLVTIVTDYYNGYFKCVAEFGNKTETDDVVVEVLPDTTAIPLVYVNNSNATYVMVGTDFSLICVVRTDVHAYLSLQWSCPIKDNVRKNESQKTHRDDTYLHVYSNLRILNATANDTGSYRCSVLDHSQRENFAEVNVTVYATTPLTILTFEGGTEEKIASKNEKIVLTAPYEVFPPTSDIRTKWSKDEEPIISHFKHIPRHTNSIFALEISDLNGNDSGLYTVTANTSGGISKKSFFLRVKDKPFVDLSANPSCCYSPELQYNIICKIKGYPLPNITWSWKPICFNDTGECNTSHESGAWIPFEKHYSINNSTITTIIKDRSIISNVSVVARESGFYKCKAENKIGATEQEKLFIVSDAAKGFEIIYNTKYSQENTQSTALCKASVVLYSDLHWKWINNVTNESKIISTNKPVLSGTVFSLETELREITESENRNYVCAATSRNTGNIEEKSLLLGMKGSSEIVHKGPENDTHLLLILIVLGTSLILIVGGVCMIKITINKKKKKVTLTDLDHHFLEGKMGLFDSNLPLDEQVDILPYDETWEFPREKLKLGRTLGQGAFGRVVKAEAFEISDDGISTTVAVKMLKERTDRNQQKSLMDELKILIHLGHHVNILNLMGAVTKKIHKEGLMVIVEYCQYGNVRHYLQRHRGRFINEIDLQTGKVISNGDIFFSDYETSHGSSSELMHNSSSTSSGVFSVHNPNYRQARGRNSVCCNPRGSDCSHIQYLGSSSTSSGSVFRSYSGSDTQDTVVTTSDLLCFTFQCARGMDYLASRKLIHRDLAARNILLAEGKIVKICDFGLAKDCYKYSNYVKKGDGPLPIKWMSIESIWDHVFTTKSDVWSFGILMWEIFTLGGNPYPGLDIDEHFYKKLKSGYRMERPELCPVFAYQIMKNCWYTDPDKRPHFSQISEMLGNSLDESIKQHYIDVNEPYMEMNRKMKSPFYSNVEISELEGSMHPYVNSKVMNFAPHYDVPRVRSILEKPFPSEPMEVVPMIQLESNPEAPCNISNKGEATKLHYTKNSTTADNLLEKPTETP